MGTREADNIPMKRPAYTCPKRPLLVRNMTIPRIQRRQSCLVAHKRPMRSQRMNALISPIHAISKFFHNLAPSSFEKGYGKRGLPISR